MQAISSDILSLINSPQQQDDSSNELGQEDFINLMVTQLRNQDPFEPLQSGEFIGQLAQFGTVSGISELQNSVSDLASSLISNQTLQATNLIGKNALVSSDNLSLKEGESIKGAISTSAPANNVTVSIFDAAGNLVQTLPLGVVNEGLKEFEWDGVDASGNQAPEGNYFLSVVGAQGEDNIALDTFAYKKIESISLGENTNSIRLNVENGGELKISEILKIE
ncbi:MAG: flagellar hook assembly protein FlgD [Gammaproteobacteria bacterium]|nr:flagellar hook assembly protein FlgD [Gammaproteobacteria bacterium]NNC68647.1 flagellar hook assembly protein FlgD [Gammaproteobacteria bacterium]